MEDNVYLGIVTKSDGKIELGLFNGDGTIDTIIDNNIEYKMEDNTTEFVFLKNEMTEMAKFQVISGKKFAISELKDNDTLSKELFKAFITSVNNTMENVLENKEEKGENE